ncbi:hypothetical protein D3C86_1464630 [compost metagenome]
MQAGLVGLGLHAALAQHHVTGEGGGLGLLLVAGGPRGDEGRRLGQRRVVIHARALRLDIGAGAIGGDLRQLGLAQLRTRYPVEVAVVAAARSQRAAAIVAGLRGCCASRCRLRHGLRAVAADRAGLRARRQGGRGGLRRAGPAAGGGNLAVELLGGVQERSGTQGQQAAGNQEGELSAEQGGGKCHLIDVRASCAPTACAAARLSMGWSKIRDNKAMCHATARSEGEPAKCLWMNDSKNWCAGWTCVCRRCSPRAVGVRPVRRS